ADEPGEFGPRGGRPTFGECAADGSLAAPGQHDDVPGQFVDQLLDVVNGPPLLPAGELGARDDPAEPVVAGLLPGDDEQVRPLRSSRSSGAPAYPSRLRDHAGASLPSPGTGARPEAIRSTSDHGT